MRREPRNTKHFAVLSAMALVAALPLAAAGTGGGGGGGSGGGTGDTYADLIMAWRDVDGVPVLASFVVDGETGPTVEYCVQPVSAAPLPGLGDDHRVINGVDGREVYRIPLMGELGPVSSDETDETSACDPQPAYAMYVTEAELERLNMARQPDNVLQQKLDEVSLRLMGADSITLDAAGRLTTDGTAIDAAPDHAAMYASLMETGTVPGLGPAPAQVGGFDTWMLAAAAVGTATGKEVPLNADSIEYYNRIVGIAAEHVPTASWTLGFLETDPPNGERFVDFGAFSYTRDAVFRGCATWLDVPTLTWKVDRIQDLVGYAPLPPVARDTNGDGIADTVDNVAGFARLADDVRSTILFLHEHDVIPGFFIDPVGQDSCTAQTAALSQPAVSLGGVPDELIQTDVAHVSASLYLPWAGTPMTNAQLRFTVTPTDPGAAFTSATDVSAVATSGDSTGQAISFELVGGSLVGRWGPPAGFPVWAGFQQTTSFDLVVHDAAPVGSYTVTLDLIDVAAADAVRATDSETLVVSDAALTVQWAPADDFATQGTYVPVTVRVFNPDLGGETAGQPPVTGGQLRFTIDAPEPFTVASQVGAWHDAVALPFALDGDGDLVGAWALPDPLPVPFDQQLTWWLNVAAGAPIGLYQITVEALDGGVAVRSADVVEITFAAATEHGQEPEDPGGDGDLPPVATITSGPATVTSADSATFVLTSDDDTATFSCSLDGATPSVCTSPVVLDDLADGTHTLAVTAAGKNGKPGPTAVWTWTVDTVAPHVQLTSAPAALTANTTATFAFTSDDPAATFACAVDGGVLLPCTSPVVYGDLGVGAHSFAVTASDAARNQTAATYQWTVAPAGGGAAGEDGTTTVTPMSPVRLADTRPGWEAADGRFTGTGPLPAGHTIEIQIAGRGGIPTTATAAVLNITTTGATTNGYATVYPTTPLPDTSTINYRANQDIANEIITKLSPTGTIRIYTSATTNLIIDATGHL